MPSCKEVLAVLTDYLEDHVSAEIRRHLEAHLAHCTTCSVIYDSTRKTIRIVTDSGSFDLPDHLSERITERIMEKIRKAGGRTAPDRSGS